MMGRQAKGQQVKMFYRGFCLEERVRQNHPLRAVKKVVDFDFIYKEVAHTYGINGHVSTAPPIILKLMFLLIFYNVRSERELVATVPERIDWLWFLDFDFDDKIPDHSVLSKSRARWGSGVFRHFFDKIVCRCVEAGLVDGSKIFVDSSLIEADAAKSSIVDMDSLKTQLNRHYAQLEARLEEIAESGEFGEGINSTRLSTTDPDASIVTKGDVHAQLSHKVNRVVDEKSEIITATEVVSGAVNEGHLLSDLIDQHEENTQCQVATVVADSQYGTICNYLDCHDRDIDAHILSFKRGCNTGGLFTDEEFTYDPQNDSTPVERGKS